MSSRQTKNSKNTVMNSLAASLPYFSGDKSENVKTFLNQLNSIANYENWSEEKKKLILKLNCKDKALDFVINNAEANQAKSFEELEKLITKKFEQKESFLEIQNKYTQLQQKIGQSVNNLAEEVTEIVKKYMNEEGKDNQAINKISENMRLTKFLQALRQEIRIEVLKLGPSCFSEAIKFANNVQNALNDTNYLSNNLTMTQNLENNILLQQHLEQKQKIEELTKKVNELSQHKEYDLNTIQQSTSQSTARQVSRDISVRCHICERNHRTTDCWYFPSHTENRYHNRQYRYNGRNQGRHRNFQPYRSQNRRYNSQFNSRRNLN